MANLLFFFLYKLVDLWYCNSCLLFVKQQDYAYLCAQKFREGDLQRKNSKNLKMIWLNFVLTTASAEYSKKNGFQKIKAECSTEKK